ncbi:Vp11 [Kadipiro virus]|uniref:Vp11 n=1 Tax=Kadipiro virus TaxID=104580 RepID=Q9YWP9_9REOV|nr:Vp11 [Kadipiro virus]AAC72046.1 Vp11 [Kadipiro virus]
MSSLKEHRTNKANSRNLIRSPDEAPPTDNSLLNKGEILALTFSDEYIKSKLLLGPKLQGLPPPSLPPNSYGYHCNGSFATYLLRESLINVRHIFAHCAPNLNNSVATNVAKSAVAATIASGTVEQLRYCQLGSLGGDLPDRSSTLMVLYECDVAGSTTSDDFGKINIIYQTCTSSVSSTLSWRISKVSMPITSYISKCLYVTNTDLVPMPGINLSITTSDVTSKFIIKPPFNTKVLFFCCVRDREHTTLINDLFALTNIPNSG